MAVFADYEHYDGIGLARLIAGREVSALEVLEAAIARIEQRNPALNAVIHTFYDVAREQARNRLPEKPLAGVPYLLKDLYQGYAGQPTGNGSRLWRGFVSPADFTLTERYKAAGLIILGKTNTPEMGLAAATEPVAHGPTRNPWNRAYSPAGSSGGAAAAVAARMLPLAHATDGGGSIRLPASNCGLFGLKPTRARNPAGPMVGEGWSGLATGHCVSLSVRDSAALLDLSHGPAPGDPYAAPPPARAFLDEIGADPRPLRIALQTGAPNGQAVHPECVKAVETAARLCADLGHRVEIASFDYHFAAMNRALRIIVAGSLRNALEARWLALGRKPSPQDLEQVTWLWSEEGRRYHAADYANALFVIHNLGRQLAAFFENYDVLLTPVMTEPPLKLGVIDMMSENLDAYLEMFERYIPFTPLYNVSGCPAMSVPLHWTPEQLPVGAHFGARFGDEATLFRLAAQLEQAQPWASRKPVLD